MATTHQHIEDALAEVIDQSLGPDWTSRDAARCIMDQLSDIGLIIAPKDPISTPNESGSFQGDLWFGDASDSARPTHVWDALGWRKLPELLRATSDASLVETA
jgi:hypothetical protein